MPEHPVIAAMERSGEPRGRAWCRWEARWYRKPQVRQGQEDLDAPERECF